VARVHGDEGGVGQIGAHHAGVPGRDAGRPDALQEHGLQVDQLGQAAGDVQKRLAGADPVAFGVHRFDVEAGAARIGHAREPVERQLGREDHRAPHEHGVGGIAVAEAAHDLACPQKVAVGVAGLLRGARTHAVPPGRQRYLPGSGL
jgi:hypothetical protein